MDRLSDMAIWIIDDMHTERMDYNSEYVPLMDALQRLAAYEDTGLEPEEVTELVEHGEITPQQEYFISEKADSIIAGLKELLTEVNERDHAAELLQAESEGRLIVLPCKVGDTVWLFSHDKTSVKEWYVKHIGVTVINYGFGREIEFDDFGKTAFPTREAAEAALGGDSE